MGSTIEMDSVQDHVRYTGLQLGQIDLPAFVTHGFVQVQFQYDLITAPGITSTTALKVSAADDASSVGVLPGGRLDAAGGAAVVWWEPSMFHGVGLWSWRLSWPFLLSSCSKVPYVVDQGGGVRGKQPERQSPYRGGPSQETSLTFTKPTRKGPSGADVAALPAVVPQAQDHAVVRPRPHGLLTSLLVQARPPH
ncbi:hypothetical protein THAOC_34784, partial [Thalassiosira oceanica]